MTKKDKLQIKVFLLLNLFISESLAVCQILFRQASKSLFLMFMIVVAVFAGQEWYAMQIYDDKKRFVNYNLFFLLLNVFFCAVTICGNNLVWTIVLIAAMIIAVIVCLFIIRKNIMLENKSRGTLSFKKGRMPSRKVGYSALFFVFGESSPKTGDDSL